MANAKINHEDQYRKIIELYDVAEQLIQSVEAAEIEYMEAQLSIIEPVVENVNESADVLTGEYSIFATHDADPRKIKRNYVESAIRRIFASIEEYKARVGNSGALRQLLALTVDPIINKLKNLAEEIIIVFMKVVSIVLEKILHKHEAEELKKRKKEIALLISARALSAT